MHIVTQNPRIKSIYTFQRSGILEEDGQKLVSLISFLEFKLQLIYAHPNPKCVGSPD